MTKQQRAELFEEYYKQAGFVQTYDSYFLTIKTWGVTASGFALGTGFSKDLIAQNRQIEVFAIALILALAFWLTEVRFKLVQTAHIKRQSALEQALQDNIYIKNPCILESFSEGINLNTKVKNWRKIIFFPHVMFPHIIFVLFCFVVIIAELIKHLTYINP